jgi:hypothetical protein
LIFTSNFWGNAWKCYKKVILYWSHNRRQTLASIQKHRTLRFSFTIQKPTWVNLVVLAWDLGVCFSQNLKFDSLWCQFQCASLSRVKEKLRLLTDPPQVDDEICLIKLVDPLTEYRDFKKKKFYHTNNRVKLGGVDRTTTHSFFLRPYSDLAYFRS